MAKYFVSKISEKVEISEVIIETKEKKVVNNRHIVERLFGHRVYTVLKSIKSSLKEDRQLQKIEYEAELKAKKKYLPDFHDRVKQYNYQTAKINFNSTEDLLKLKEKNFDLFILFGTSIVKDALLEIPSVGTINIHTSLLPYYKGTAVEFWQLLNEDHDHCGVTIHYVDTGVDTGNIIVQEGTQVASGDTFYDLRYKNIQKAIEIMPKAIQMVGENYAGIAQKESNQKAYIAKMLVDEKKIIFYKRLGLYR